MRTCRPPPCLLLLLGHLAATTVWAAGLRHDFPRLAPLTELLKGVKGEAEAIQTL